MSHIQASVIAPYIHIEARTEDQYRAAEYAIEKIASKKNGASLLDEIQKLSTNGKALKVVVVSVNSAARPVLTEKQAEAHQVSKNEFHAAHNAKAIQLASKQSLGRKGEGTSASIDWNPRQSVKIDASGRPKLIDDTSLSFASLAHELVHGYRMMKGTFTGGTSDRYDPSTPAAEEEDRAVGTGKFSKEPLSENGIRSEHGLPLRQFYRAAPDSDSDSGSLKFN
ncbi:XopG/HopH/AvrPtoH family type III secretion system effector [Janthinobacterium agaricidamnosum]|uniref:Type III effector protein n=1 Tax=Janthinobacterium agaricidamnosum NBRC 102515 = DSM 9628 TaxID=1349767 RepID=W0VF70_9BURK|nr:XopG/HopH/AvrPtoH family type III secretion system effector [Janthinobacterium agaricidamnosum]CDG85992.1 type III effector protein [Janthinobacterium agaricidamnosum NBRC 102515 = DSM 9628]